MYEFVESPMFVLVFYIITLFANLAFWLIIIKMFINLIRRSINHSFFKSNVIYNNSNEEKYYDQKEIYKDISKEKLKQNFNTDDLDSFKDFLYKIFVDFEKGYNDLDYNTMKSLSTKQHYENYYTGITLDLKKGEKRIINSIKKKEVIVFDVLSTSLKQIVSTIIEVSYIDYTINKSGVVVRGDRDNPITDKFEVTFKKEYEKEDVIKCPNCGANVVGNKCEYCRTTLKNNEFKISSIKKIIE